MPRFTIDVNYVTTLSEFLSNYYQHNSNPAEVIDLAADQKICSEMAASEGATPEPLGLPMERVISAKAVPEPFVLSGIRNWGNRWETRKNAV